MSVRAFVQSDSGQAVVVEAMQQGNEQRQRETPSPARKSGAEHQTEERCSPDPCQHTDRYRLVTPFSLRL